MTDPFADEREPKYRDLEPAITRQRRLLIGISLALTAKYLLVIEAGENIELLGSTFKISQPDLLVAGGWVVWVWALIRYAQYFRDVCVYEIMKVRRQEANRELLRIIMRSLQKQIDHPGIQRDGKRLQGKVTDISLPEVDPTSVRGWEYEGFAEFQVNPDGGRSYRSMLATIRNSELGQELTHQFSPTVSREELLRARKVGGLRYAFQSHYFTELSAPFLIAAIAPLTWIVSNWRYVVGCV